MAQQTLAVISNSGPGGSAGAGMTKAVYRFPVIFTKASTHTAQTLVPLATFYRAGTIKSVSASWLEVNAANTTLATVDVLKRAAGAAAAGVSILGTVGTLTNNATTQTMSFVSTGAAVALNTGSANVNPILSTTASKLAISIGDSLTLTTVATSTQGTDLCVVVEVEYNLADDTTTTTLQN